MLLVKTHPSVVKIVPEPPFPLSHIILTTDFELSNAVCCNCSVRFWNFATDLITG